MPSGKSPYVRRNIDVIVSETVPGLAQEALSLAAGSEPQTYELAARRFDQAAEACRQAERQLRAEQLSAWKAGVPPAGEPAPGVPPHVHKFLKDYLASNVHRPDAFQVIAIAAGSDIGKILLTAMVKGGHTR